MRFEAAARRRRRPGLTPLIDVVFLLLVFFMLASTLVGERTLELEVTRAAPGLGTGREDDPLEPLGGDDRIRIVLAADGRLSLAGAPVELADLAAAVRRALDADGERGLRIVPDPDANLQRIVDVLERAQSAGASDVALERVAQGH